MLVQTDSRRRITLPSSAGIRPGDAVSIEVMEDGRVVLTPVEPVPRHQMWAWTSEARKAVAESLADRRPSEIIETPAQADDLARRWTDEG